MEDKKDQEKEEKEEEEILKIVRLAAFRLGNIFGCIPSPFSDAGHSRHTAPSPNQMEIANFIIFFCTFFLKSTVSGSANHAFQ